MCVSIREREKREFSFYHNLQNIFLPFPTAEFSHLVSQFYVKLFSQFFIRAQVCIARETSPQAKKNKLFIYNLYLCILILCIPLLDSQQSVQCPMTTIKTLWKLIAYKIALFFLFFFCRSPIRNVQILDIFFYCCSFKKNLSVLNICKCVY